MPKLDQTPTANPVHFNHDFIYVVYEIKSYWGKHVGVFTYARRNATQLAPRSSTAPRSSKAAPYVNLRINIFLIILNSIRRQRSVNKVCKDRRRSSSEDPFWALLRRTFQSGFSSMRLTRCEPSP